ncbi:hypothetical protein HA388_27435, partial [Escherichia coli]|nr:hypothetical protein [Escherichia coli]
NGYGTKGVTIPGKEVYESLKKRLGTCNREGIGKGNPELYSDQQAVNAILLMSGATNGKRAVAGWKSMEAKTGKKLEAIAAPREEEDHTLESIT